MYMRPIMIDRHILFRLILIAIIGPSLLSACFYGSDNSASNTPVTSDDPSPMLASIRLEGQTSVTGATITVKSANGDTLLASTVSDTDASYDTMVTDKAIYPYILTATAGVDLVTGTPPGFTLVSAVTSPDDVTANLNPFSTLIVKTAQAMPGGLTAANLDQARQSILQHLGFGLDISALPDPVTTPITAQNVADTVKAGEALAEMIRRTHAALQVAGNNLSENDIILAIAADMTDGFLDGNGASGTRPLVTAMANVVSGKVLIEALSNNLNVNGAWATDLLDGAIRATLPGTTEMTAQVPINTAILDQTKTAIGAAQPIDPSEELSTLALIVNSLDPGSEAADIEAVLTEKRGQDFDDAITMTANATSSQLAAINSAVRQTSTPPEDDKMLALAWYSNPGNILGYIVYYGTSPASATNIASETSGTSVKYYTQLDLGLDPGDSVCFRLKAFNLAGLSGFSGAACMTI